MQRVQRGFTLIEVLVVVSILGVLAGLISILVVQAQGKRYQMEAETVVKTELPTAIERFRAELNNRLPPMTSAELAAFPGWAGLSISPANTANECNEVLLVALRHKDLTAPLNSVTGSKPFGNTDNDIWNKVPEGSPDENAKEILDAWGNPIVYITKNHYGETVKITKEDGTEVEVEAVKGPSGAYYNATSYQVISLGKNGVQDLDSDVTDDIENFTREE